MHGVGTLSAPGARPSDTSGPMGEKQEKIKSLLSQIDIFSNHFKPFSLNFLGITLPSRASVLKTGSQSEAMLSNKDDRSDGFISRGNWRSWHPSPCLTKKPPSLSFVLQSLSMLPQTHGLLIYFPSSSSLPLFYGWEANYRESKICPVGPVGIALQTWTWVTY